MIKLILIEDECQMLEQLVKILDWTELGFEITAAFSNGAEALEYIKNNKVDAILSDIKVPHLSGIELTKICFEQYPDIKVALISAYRDFEFAQEAIRYNVINYVTKPIIYDDFRLAMIQLHDAAVKKQQTEFIDDELSLHIQQLFSDYLNNAPIDNNQFLNKLNELGIIINYNCCRCAHINIHINNLTDYLSSVWRKEKERLYNAINNFIPFETKNAYFTLFKYSYDNLEIIALCKVNLSLKEFQIVIDEFILNLNKNLSETLSLDLNISILQIADSINAFKKYDSSGTFIKRQATMILSQLHKHNADDLIKNIDNIYSSLNSNTELKNFFLEYLYNSIFDMLDDDEKELYKSELSKYYKLNPSELYNYIIYLIRKLSVNGVHSENYTINKALEYIEKNISKDITLKDVACYVSLNSDYFSTYFKKHTGFKLIDYISKIRIEKAQKLLKLTNHKITSISEIVGYKDPHYFHRIFKAYTGLTPLEFRNSNRKD